MVLHQCVGNQVVNDGDHRKDCVDRQYPAFPVAERTYDTCVREYCMKPAAIVHFDPGIAHSVLSCTRTCMLNDNDYGRTRHSRPPNPTPLPIVYSRNKLVHVAHLRRYKLPSDTVALLKSLGILKRRRGCRSGHHKRHNIPVLITSAETRDDYLRLPESDSGANTTNLVHLQKTVNPHLTKRQFHFPSVFLCNPRSLNNKMDEYRSVVLDNAFDICAISESWFMPDRDIDYYNIEGYNLFSKPRSSRIGGGVALYVKESLHASVLLNVDTPADLEILWIKVHPRRLPRAVSTLIFAAVYFPDRTMEDIMINHIQDALDVVRINYPDAGICILGDLNHLDITPFVGITSYNKRLNNLQEEMLHWTKL